MIPLKPVPYNNFECPKCHGGQVIVTGSNWSSFLPLADVSCEACGHNFWATFPVSHALDQKIAIEKDSLQLKDISRNDKQKWLYPHLSKLLKNVNKREIKIEKRQYKEADKVVILNTLDFLYGHVLLKLFNADHYLAQDDLGLVLIIPKMFEWLIPDGCAEAWIVDIKMGEGLSWMPQLDNFVHEQLGRFTEVRLSKAFSHPELGDVDIERYSKVKPFDLDRFSKEKPIITIITREDRIWFKSKFAEFVHKVLSKLKLKGLAQKIALGSQNKRYIQAIKKIRSEVPNAEFNIVGLGKTGSFGKYATDLRAKKMNKNIELGWCNTYAQSQIIIGIHGSNMLIPTAHAAACVEILPQDRYGNIVQDIFVRYKDRRQLFCYRFIDEFAKPGEVSAHVIAMLNDYSDYYKAMVENTHAFDQQEETTKEIC